ncbi:MAG TPA: sulfur oxidation c-type cytochrome SoxA [Ramlibacter sp.]|nr:sulfur oxidation c-type cytochrome SoxA [Ramlibacter sp.]
MRRLPTLLAAVVLAACAAPTAKAPQRSGFQDMSASTQALQRDDTANPAMLWVEDGRQLWTRAAGPQSKSCSSCHGDVATMKGVAVRYPAFDDTLRRPVNLGTRINLCRQRHQQLPAWPAEHQELLSLEALVGLQSRGLPIAPPRDARLEPFRTRGEALFQQRIGQVDLSCAQCHDQRAGGRLAGTLIPQGQASGYPIYRLEWQALGSLGRRIRNCMSGVRAEPLAHGSVEMAELELHLAARAMGMPMETPAVRP